VREIIKKGKGDEMERHSGLRFWMWVCEWIHVIHETTTPGGKKMGGVQKLRQLRAEGYYSYSLHLLLKSVRQRLDPWI
jgi:hypothetical protein